MDIKILDDCNAVNWDSFVHNHPQATFFHKAGWRNVLQSAFGHDTYYLYVEDNCSIQAILPLGHIKSKLFGNSLISTPFCVYGGIVSSNEKASQLLDKAAYDLARDLKVDYLELRNIEDSFNKNPKSQLYVTFRKALFPDYNSNFMAIPRKQRAMIRKGISVGLKSVIDTDLTRFYNMYSESLRNLGTPVLGRRYFEILKHVFVDDVEIISIENNYSVVSSVLNFFFRDEILPYYGGGSTLARELSANDFMYWEVMKHSVDRGCKIFDFGRSKSGSGSYRFKLHWGFESKPLHYEYQLVNSTTLPEINPLNPKYKYFISAWKHLPLRLSTLIGPFISKNIG